MKVSYINSQGQTQEVVLTDGQLMEASRTGNPVAFLNRAYPDADMQYGSAFDQFKVSAGLIRADAHNPFGLRTATLGSVLDQSGVGANTAQQASPFGTSARAFTIISVIDEVMSEVQRDRVSDTVAFNEMVANTLSLTSEVFEQPVVDYTNAGGPEKAKAQRVSQGALPPKMLFFRTSEKVRRIGSWTIGMEWTDQALKNTNIDFVARTTAHYLLVEQDERVNRYINDLFVGDNEFIMGAVPSVTSVSLDAASTGGVLTHKAWVKFLARNRKYRKITHAIMDVDTYLKFESRQGRPGSNNYDPTLVRIDPQGMVVNNSFGNDVRIMIVDSAAEGGPIPVNTIWVLDASIAVTKVINTAAAYSAVEEYSMKRTQAMRIDWSEATYRTMGDTELRPFDSLTIS